MKENGEYQIQFCINPHNEDGYNPSHSDEDMYGREEQEIVVNPRYLYGLEEIKYEAI